MRVRRRPGPGARLRRMALVLGLCVCTVGTTGCKNAATLVPGITAIFVALISALGRASAARKPAASVDRKTSSTRKPATKTSSTRKTATKTTKKTSATKKKTATTGKTNSKTEGKGVDDQKARTRASGLKRLEDLYNRLQGRYQTQKTRLDAFAPTRPEGYASAAQAAEEARRALEEAYRAIGTAGGGGPLDIVSAAVALDGAEAAIGAFESKVALLQRRSRDGTLLAYGAAPRVRVEGAPVGP